MSLGHLQNNQWPLTMLILRGKPISPGYAAGVALVEDANPRIGSHATITHREVEAELIRLEKACRQSRHELREIRDRVHRELGKSHSAIFESHLAVLDDPRFADRIRRRIEHELVNADQAVDFEIREYCDQLARANSPYFRERQQDVRDIGRRILGHLANVSVATSLDMPERSVLVVRELFPSDALNLDRAHVAAIVTEEGGETSHMAVLARALAVPAVSGVSDVLQHIQNGMHVLVDGETGEVVVSPSPSEARRFSAERNQWEVRREPVQAAEHLPCITADGVGVSLQANIRRPEESEQVSQHCLDGVGLLRTEFLFLDASAPPSREFQSDIYRFIANAVQSRPVVVRTLDISGDKRPRFLSSRFAGKYLGARGLRLSLDEGLFQTQAAAIVQAAKDHDVRILLPMVIEASDVFRAIQILNEKSKEEGLARPPLLGVMIETPAALLLLETFIEAVDFVSIGTNDLTQFMLAIDREAIDRVDGYSALHPAVLRAIRQTVAHATKANKPISVCGEAAGDPRTACLLVGMGVRQLSMSPVRAGDVRYLLRLNELTSLELLAERALTCSTTEEVRKLLCNWSWVAKSAPQRANA